MKQEKNCQNCRYYLAHYSKTNIGYVKTTCGHCTQIMKKPFKGVVCERWERIENTVPELEKKLDSRIAYLEKNIDSIRNVLELLKDVYGIR